MQRTTSTRIPSVALVLGGGRGSAHIGVSGVLEREGIRVNSIAESSMGGFIGVSAARSAASGSPSWWDCFARDALRCPSSPPIEFGARYPDVVSS